jgi:hypothetical protein
MVATHVTAAEAATTHMTAAEAATTHMTATTTHTAAMTAAASTATATATCECSGARNRERECCRKNCCEGEFLAHDVTSVSLRMSPCALTRRARAKWNSASHAIDRQHHAIVAWGVGDR